jgi:hypothetical protein
MNINQKAKRVVDAGLFAERVLGIIEDLPQYLSIDKLRQAGIVVLGSGCFGSALLSPCGGFVLKVCWQEFDGYPIYARWAKANPGPHIPAIFYTAQIGKTFVAAMPLLAELSTDQEIEVLEQRTRGLHNAPDDADTELAKAIRRVKWELGDLCSLDMHTGNFLADQNGTIYITDPFSGCNDVDYAVAKVTGHEFKRQVADQLELDLSRAEDYRMTPQDYEDQALLNALLDGVVASEPTSVLCDFSNLEQRVLAGLQQRQVNIHNPYAME